MTLKTVEEKIDDAVYAVFDALGLSVKDNIDASVAINEAITPIAEKLVADDTDEAAGPDFVETFDIQVGRDARVYYSATTTGTLQEIMNNMSRHGYAGEVGKGGWKRDGVDCFDNVETVNIYDTASSRILARYTTSEGWEMDPED